METRERNTSGTKRKLAGTKAAASPKPRTRATIPCSLVADVEELDTEGLWLAEGFWSGVGLIAATPKCGKTFLGIDLAVSVASGTPVLGRFEVRKPGPVLVYPAEDHAGAIRSRVEALCRHRGIELDGLPLHIITSDSLKLDDDGDRKKLEALLQEVRPVMVLFDPLVRLHTGAEGDTGHMSRLLGYLRELQRRFDVSVVLTHHMGKRQASVQPGQAMRGSSDLHGWTDSGAYLRRLKGGLVELTLEHRVAAHQDPYLLQLVTHQGGKGAHFEILGQLSPEDESDEAAPRPARTKRPAAAPKKLPLRERVLAVLQASDEPMPQVAIREALKVRNQALSEALRALESEAAIASQGHKLGWMLATSGQTSTRAQSR